MAKHGIPFPDKPRDTALLNAEEWYQQLLAERLGLPIEPIQRSDFGRYNMAVHYLTSVLDEAKAIQKVAVFNIDHMAQILFSGRDAASLLNRTLPTNIESMSFGQCKYTLLLNADGTTRDDLIVMRLSATRFILVINAGHDITDTFTDAQGNHIELLSDASYIMSHKYPQEDVTVKDLSAELVKVDVQGPLSYKVIKSVFGDYVLKNRNNPAKNMSFFTFNEVSIDGETYYFSRTGYTNRWGWEIYIPVRQAEERFKQIVLKVLELGGLLVGLGGRDENRLSAGNVGLPLMGNEYSSHRIPTNTPLYDAAIDLSKPDFVGKQALINDKDNPQRLVLIITEGNVVHYGVYHGEKRLGTVTSCIISPNIPLEKRLYLGSTRKNVNEENGTAAIALAWLNHLPYGSDENGNDIATVDGQPIRKKVDLYREKDGQPIGKPTLGYISADGVNPATAPKPLKEIEGL